MPGKDSPDRGLAGVQRDLGAIDRTKGAERPDIRGDARHARDRRGPTERSRDSNPELGRANFLRKIGKKSLTA